MALRKLIIAIAGIALALAAYRSYARVDPFFGLGTVYAPGYDEGLFDDRLLGLPGDRVEALIGPPLSKVPWHCGVPASASADLERWLYSNHPADGNYHERLIILDATTGRVRQVIKQFWVD